MKIDRRFRNGLMLTNSYTLQPLLRLRRTRTATISTPIDFEQSWARSNFDRLHNYTLDRPLRAAVGTEQAVAEGRPARQDHRRLAGERHLRRAVRRAAEHHRQRHDAEHAGQHRLRQPERREQRARRPRPGQPVLRSDGLFAAGGRRAGQHDAEQRSRGAGLLAARRLAVQALRRRRLAATPSSASTPTTSRTRCAGATRTPASASPPATPSARSPARPAASAASGSAGRFVF